MDLYLLQNNTLRQYLFPKDSHSTRSIALPKSAFDIPADLNELSLNYDDADVAVFSYYQDVVNRILDHYERQVERLTTTEKDEVSTGMQEYHKLLWKTISEAWLNVNEASATVVHENDYRIRIAALHEMAADEGFTVAKATIEAFWKLIYALSPMNKAQLVLSQQGVLTAIWKDGDGNYAHVKFLEADKVRYVMVTPPLHGSTGNSVVGDCSIEGVKALIEEHNLENLLGLYGQ